MAVESACQLELAIDRLNGSRLVLDTIGAFWRTLGRPTARLGDQRGRNLVNGNRVTQVGGGLCQLSGLLVHLGQLAGLEVVERQAHSVDGDGDSERASRPLAPRPPWPGNLALCSCAIPMVRSWCWTACSAKAS